MDTARMIRKARRRLPCRFGCCQPDWTGRNKAARRALKRRARNAERRDDRRAAA